MFIAAAAAILIALALVLVRALAGPTIFDRVLAARADSHVGLLDVHTARDCRRRRWSKNRRSQLRAPRVVSIRSVVRRWILIANRRDTWDFLWWLRIESRCVPEVASSNVFGGEIVSSNWRHRVFRSSHRRFCYIDSSRNLGTINRSVVHGCLQPAANCVCVDQRVAVLPTDSSNSRTNQRISWRRFFTQPCAGRMGIE